jgi:hypothetical protein
MASDYQARVAEIDEYAAELRTLIPEALSAFGALSKTAQTAGVLDSFFRGYNRQRTSEPVAHS